MNFVDRRIVALALACTLVALVSYGCNDAESQDPPWPPGLIVATPTADVRGVLSPDAGAELLARESPVVAGVIAAIERGDAEALLKLVQWQEMACGPAATYCPGVQDGARTPVVDAGSAVTFFVTADVIRPYLEKVLSGSPPPLTFASRRKDNADRYYVAFESQEGKGFGDLPLLEPDRPLHGFFLELDGTSAAPIVRIDFQLTPDYSSERKARDIGLEDQVLIVFPAKPGQ